MLNLYAINLHIQECLERDWIDEVCATKAAQWLHEVDLLTDHKHGLPLRNLLRRSRIAGQEQRPNRKHGQWFIRRLATSRDPAAIRVARDRIRFCLPIDRKALPVGWPTHQGPQTFSGRSSARPSRPSGILSGNYSAPQQLIF